jgi:hypothetical protein
VKDVDGSMCQWEIFRIQQMEVLTVPYKTIFCGDIPEMAIEYVSMSMF